MRPKANSPRFPAALVRAIDRSKILGVRAGMGAHRFIGIWVVTVDGRVYVRSWGVKPGGWYRTWRNEPDGVMTVQGRTRQIRVRAVPVRSERMKRAISDAYAAKYHTPGSLQYVRDLARKKCRNASLELVPR